MFEKRVQMRIFGPMTEEEVLRAGVPNNAGKE
jgi:hypothetical protein